MSFDTSASSGYFSGFSRASLEKVVSRVPPSVALEETIPHHHSHLLFVARQLRTRNTEDICMDDGPSSMKLWKKKFFFIDHRALSDYLTWRSTQSRVCDDFPTNDRNDVTQLCARLARLGDVNEAVLIWFGRSFAWFNQKCDPVFKRKDDNPV
ncbi:hypothetical protein Tco_1127755 [Tanacetum coccineum]